MFCYCSKCGSSVSLVTKGLTHIPYSLYLGEGRGWWQTSYPVTVCCCTRPLYYHEVPTTYMEDYEEGDSRIYSEIPSLIKLCNAIGKSPFSIRFDGWGRPFIAAKSKSHRNAISMIMRDTLSVELQSGKERT